MATNKSKTPPKNDIKFSISLSGEQKIAKSKILTTPFNFILGKAGSGKTLLAVQIALDMFFKRRIDKIIMTRPTVSNEDNGFLPGSLQEKMDPWLVPIRSNMRKVYNKPDVLDKMEKEESIELVSLAHFRGRTFDNAICIVDEFQNLTKQQLCESIKEQIPSLQIFYNDNFQDPDKRDYIVSNLKLESSGWTPQFSLDDGIEELIKTYTILISDLSSKYRNDFPLGYGIK